MMLQHEILAQAREARGLTQQWVAMQLGIDKDRYSRIELGKAPAHREIVEKLAQLYKEPFEALWRPMLEPKYIEKVALLTLAEVMQTDRLLERFLGQLNPDDPILRDADFTWVRQSLSVILTFLRDRSLVPVSSSPPSAAQTDYPDAARQ